jgi:adenylate kinase family enzyme
MDSVDRRVVILGRGGAGKSTFAARLGAVTGIPVIELDTVFWRADLTPTPPDAWAAWQRELVARPGWIADGDLGPHDVLDVCLAAADTVLLFDYALGRCAWRVLRRGWEGIDFWRWVWAYRRRWRPRVLERITAVAPDADVRVFRRPRRRPVPARGRLVVIAQGSTAGLSPGRSRRVAMVNGS